MKELVFDNLHELFAWLSQYSPGTVILQGFNEAIATAVPVAPDLVSLVYLKEDVLKVLCRDFEMNYDEAAVYFREELLTRSEKAQNPLFIERVKE